MDLWNFKTIPISSAQQTKSKFCLPRGRKNDVWSFIWGTQNYSSRKFYALAFQSMQVPSSFTWLWKSKCTPRIKFFGWLILVDRLNTRGMLKQRNFHLDQGYNCVMCNRGVEEDLNHPFFTVLLLRSAGNLCTFIGLTVKLFT